MTIVVDAGPLYSQADRRDPDHDAVVRVLRETREPLVVPAFVAAEADFLILTRLGVETELAFLEDLASGAFQVESLTPAELRTATEVARRYRDLELGLADVSVVVLAARFRTRRLLTFDERAFRAVAPLQGGRFALLPADR
ncbi:MAG TPA: PIN domain-containing protein [Actinomycetota bacterium]|nr:PIN domain-containing protein [Actinomycetota bacterium]